MSLRKIRARLIVSGDTGDVRAVEVFGHVLTETFVELEVSEEVFGKLRDNPHIEVQVPKSEAGPNAGSAPPRGKPADQPQG